MLQVLHFDAEACNAAGQFFARVPFREFRVHFELVIDVLTGEGSVELGTNLTRSQLELHPLPSPFLQLLAVDEQGKVDADNIPALRWARRRWRFEASVLATQ